MIRPTVARIDLDALKSNYRRIVEYLAAAAGDRTPDVIAVVKGSRAELSVKELDPPGGKGRLIRIEDWNGPN